MSYDKKFRERILALLEEGHKQEELRKMFKLGANTITKWKKLKKETESLDKRPLDRKWRKIDPEKLRADVEERPNDLAKDRARRFNCSESGIKKAMLKNKIKKRRRESTRYYSKLS